jgi:LacI family transcriptional regulator
MESGYRAMQTLLAVKPRPTAVFVASDVVAFGAMAAIRDHHLSIPEDISVVGFDDVPMAPYMAPALTTVHLPASEQGRRGGEMLIDLIEGKPLSEQQLFLPAGLVVRESCGAILIG